MKAIVVTDKAAGTAGMKLVERPEPQAARLASLSGASPDVAADAQTYAELEARVLAGGMEGIALRYGFYYGPGTWFHPDGAYADKVRRQEFPIIGAGSGVWSWVHVEDAALATVEITWRGKTVYTSVWQEPVQLRTNSRGAPTASRSRKS